MQLQHQKHFANMAKPEAFLLCELGAVSVKDVVQQRETVNEKQVLITPQTVTG